MHHKSAGQGRKRTRDESKHFLSTFLGLGGPSTWLSAEEQKGTSQSLYRHSFYSLIASFNAISSELHSKAEDEK